MQFQLLCQGYSGNDKEAAYMSLYFYFILVVHEESDFLIMFIYRVVCLIPGPL